MGCENQTTVLGLLRHILLFPDRAVQKSCGFITDQTTCDRREKRGTCACNDDSLCNGTNEADVGNMAVAVALATLAMQWR